MSEPDLDPRLPLIQNADLKDKLVLVRVDHNVVKKGEIRDPYRIDATLGTLYNIVERGGRLILMTHVGRTRDKETSHIEVDDDTSVHPVVDYLERKLHTRFVVPQFPVHPEWGIREIDTSINWCIRDLLAHRVGASTCPIRAGSRVRKPLARSESALPCNWLAWPMSLSMTPSARGKLMSQRLT